MEKITAPYGSWKSPITTDHVAGSSVVLFEPLVDGNTIYWHERRPREKGRSVLVQRAPDGKLTDVNPAPYSANSRVHEYGGGASTVKQGVVYFSNKADGRIYRAAKGVEPVPVTPEAPHLRYADLQFDPGRLCIFCVLEDHSKPGVEPTNSLVIVDVVTGEVRDCVASGNDFYASPRLSPGSDQMAYLTWNHPNMPWDETELWLADAAPNGCLKNAHKIAGGNGESIFQPNWSPDGTLYFVSDRSGWWNIYKQGLISAEPVLEMEAEFGKPQWVFNMSTYAFLDKNRIAAAYTKDGFWHLGVINIEEGILKTLNTPFTVLENPQIYAGKILVKAGMPDAPSIIALVDPETGSYEQLDAGGPAPVEASYISKPQTISYHSTDGSTAYALYYPPANPEFEAPEGELPPLIVKSHSGPTSMALAHLNLKFQFWTSRGFAVLDVNYSGSTGFGTEYRRRLNGGWGVVDLDDCEYGAKYLAGQKLADPERVLITGGSAGGYTTLCALTFRPETFKTGASYYGIGDLETLATDTHKFEARYLDSLVGKYPEDKAIYQERSPINFPEKLSRPAIFFQGLEDKVVPPSQAEAMGDALRRKKLPTAYVTFADEGHGFRNGENVKRSLECEYYFYAKILNFPEPEGIEPCEIENLD